MECILGRRWSSWDGAINILNAPNRSGLVRSQYFLKDQIINWGSNQHHRTAEILAWVTNSTNLSQFHQRIRSEGVMQRAIQLRLKTLQDKSSQMGESELRKKIEIITKDQIEQTKIQEMFENENSRLEAENEEIRADIEKCNSKIIELDHAKVALQNALQNSRPGTSTNVDIRQILNLACRVDEPEPRECLDAIELVYGDVCTVLESAKDSAENLNNFAYGRKLLDMLKRLVTEYRDQLIKGGDCSARDVFGKNEFSAKESETVMKNGKMRKIRTFCYEGEEIEMFRHLKIGKEDNTEKTIRVHFHWDAEKQKIIIGYCGKHLPITSH